MKEGDKVKAIKGEFTGKEGEIFTTFTVSELIEMFNPKGSPPKNPVSPLSHFIVKQQDGSYFPALESELELIT
jgi:hypothetical protein